MLFLAAACCSVVFAQQIVTSAGRVIQAVHAPPPLTGLPYSAEQIFEHTQTLAERTHISQQPMITKIYRDSLGRTRTERADMIEISDPVTGYYYRLDSGKHVAHRDVMESSPNTPRVLQFFPGLPSDTPVPGPLTPPGPLAGDPEIAVESLGSKTIGGVTAEGRRITLTYPSDDGGREGPIVAINEFWISPVLKFMLLAIHHDRRSGDTTTRIENLSRAEPDSSLFLVPPDYEIVDENVPALNK